MFSVVVAVLVVGAVTFTGAAQESKGHAESEADWKPVAEALGKAGQLQPGGVYRVAMPRTDLKVKVGGVDITAGFALGSYAAFRRMGKDTMVMGDLVLLDEEVQDVMANLLVKGIAITALHNHLNEMSPHVMYMHYRGRGDAVQLVASIRAALSASATPLGQSAATPTPASGAP